MDSQKTVSGNLPSVILERDHRAIDGLFVELGKALAKADFVEIYSAADILWMRLALHIRAEHKILFPAVLSYCESASGKGGPGQLARVSQIITELHKDHDLFMVELAHAISFLRGSAWHTGCPDCSAEFAGVEQRAEVVWKRLIPHNKIEEESIYPLADRLDEAECQSLVQRMREELNSIPERFRPGHDRF